MTFDTNRPARRPRIEESNPRLAMVAIQLVAACGIRQAGELTGLSHTTIRRLLTRQLSIVENTKKEVSSRLLAISKLGLDAVKAKMDKCSAIEAAFIMGETITYALKLCPNSQNSGVEQPSNFSQ